MSFNDFTIFSVKKNYHGIIFWCMNKDEAINLFKRC